MTISPVEYDMLWGDEAALFALRTDCPEVAREAEQVLGFWAPPSPAPEPFCWVIEREEQGYRLTPPSELITLHQDYQLQTLVVASPEIAVLNLEFQAVAAMVGRAQSPLHLHGALLAKNGEGVALIGAKEAGKSTLATSLWSRGYELLSDDGFYFVSDTRVRPVPRRVRLRAGAKALFPQPFRLSSLPPHGQVFEQSDGCLVFLPQMECREVALRHLIVLTSDEGPLLSLDSASATLKTVVHTNSYRLHGLHRTLATLSERLSRFSCSILGRAPLDEQFERLSNIRW